MKVNYDSERDGNPLIALSKALVGLAMSVVGYLILCFTFAYFLMLIHRAMEHLTWRSKGLWAFILCFSVLLPLGILTLVDLLQ